MITVHHLNNSRSQRVLWLLVPTFGSLVIGCMVSCSGLADDYANDPAAILLQAAGRIIVGVVVIGNFQRTFVDQCNEPGLDDTRCHRAVGFQRKIEWSILRLL